MKKLKAIAFVAALLGVTGFFVITDNDEGPSFWERWTMPTSSLAAPGAVLKPFAVVDLPGPKGKRFDYLTIDYGKRWLLSAHLAAGSLYVLDLRTYKIAGTVKDVPGVEGVAVIPEMQRAYTSDWYENKIGVVDLTSFQVTARIPTDEKPDGIVYAKDFAKLYVSNERGKSVGVIDPRANVMLKILRFQSETGMPQYDPVARRVYVNLQDENTLAVIDPATDTVVARWPVPGCKSNHGMAIDPETHRAFLSCEDNDILSVFDLDRHLVVAHLPMAPGADVVDFDPGLRRIYVACGSGAISVFQEDDADHYRKLQDVPVPRRVHSLVVDRETHRVYAPEEQEDERPASRMAVYEAARR